jgi:hypothetical protein
MAKKKVETRLMSRGIYTQWNAESKELPRLVKITNEIPCELDVEFGYILNIKKAKNKKLQYCIYHPQIPDEDGNPMPPFAGEEYIKQNDWSFFIGDTIWAPVENKKGPWRVTLAIEGVLVADETFNLV